MAYDPANGDEAVSVVTGTGQAHVYLIAGANEPNEYHIETATGTPPTYGTLVKGDAYLMAGSGPSGQIADPGATTTTTGGSTSPAAVANPIAPQALAFDNSGNLLIAGHHGNTATYTSGIQMVAKATCASSCPYHYATLGAGNLYTVAGEGMRGINRTPAITFSFGVDGWGLSVDAQGNLVVGANGEVLFVNEQTSPVTRYGHSLAAQHATVVAGTGLTGSGTCGGGTVSTPAHDTTSPNLINPQPYVDANGNVYMNDNTGTAGHGCVWVLPAATGNLDGVGHDGGEHVLAERRGLDNGVHQRRRGQHLGLRQHLGGRHRPGGQRGGGPRRRPPGHPGDRRVHRHLLRPGDDQGPRLPHRRRADSHQDDHPGHRHRVLVRRRLGHPAGAVLRHHLARRRRPR